MAVTVSTVVAVPFAIGDIRMAAVEITQDAGTACPGELHPVAQIGGWSSALAVHGDVAYLAVGRRVHAIDVRPEAGATTPDGTELAALATLELSGNVGHLAVSGSTLLAGLDREPEVWAYDIGDPRAPELLGRLVLPGEVRGLVAHGDVAFVAVPNHLLTIDLGEGEGAGIVQDNPFPLIGRWPALTTHGDLLVIADWAVEAATGRLVHGIRLFDISAPAAPRDLGAAEMIPGINGLAIVGDTAYVAAASTGLQAFDVADPLLPRYLGGAEAPPAGLSAVVADGRSAFATGMLDGLHVYDVRGAAPALVATVRLPGEGPYHLRLAGDRLFVAAAGALHVVDVSSPAQPVVVSAFHTLGRASSAIALGDGHAFVGTSEGLQSVDLTDPAAPRLRGHALLPDAPEAVVLDGDRAYAASGWFIWPGTLTALALRPPDAPSRLGVIGTAGGLLSLAADSGKAWVNSIVSDVPVSQPWENQRLQAFDFADPMQPRAEGLLERPGEVIVVEGLLYVFDGDALRVLDASSPEQPRTIASVPFPNAISSAVLVGHHVFAGSYSALYAFDVTDARAPVPIGPPRVEVGAAQLAADGACLFAVSEGVGSTRRLDVVDASEPDDPRLVLRLGASDGLPEALGLAAGGGRVYLGSGSGLVVMGPEAPPTPTAAPPWPPIEWIGRVMLPAVGH